MKLFVERWRPVVVSAVMVVSGMLFIPMNARTPARAQVEPTPAAGAPYRTVTVRGTGAAEVVPDLAVVTLGVQTEANTAREALSENNTQMQAVIDTLRRAGVAERDIRTSSIQLYPRYESAQPARGESRVQLVGYTASNIVEVRVRDLNNVGTVLDQVVTAGSNQIQGIQFDVADRGAALDQAREVAMQNALHKAEQLVRLAGATLGPVVTISEDSRVPQPFGAMDMRAAEASVPISAGTQTVTVDLQVTWELR